VKGKIFVRLSKGQARRFLIAYQGLGAQYEYQGKSGILAYIQRGGCIQFDPLNIVGHNSELVLQSRVAGFRPNMLRALLYEDRKLIDGWDKMTSIYLLEDWPYFHRYREAARCSSGIHMEAVRAVLPEIRAAIEVRGPLSSLDLEINEIMDWDWARSRLARAALESMYSWGELAIHHKIHTRKFYDFAHRCLPDAILKTADPHDTDDQYHDWHVLRRIGSVGLLWNRSGDAWLGIYSTKSRYSLVSQERKAAMERLIDQGKIVEVQIEGIKEPFYLRTQDIPLLDRVLSMDGLVPRAIVMAPLDNLLWDRRMLKEIFNFDYVWEVYVPEDKRRYGYYVLPILYGDRFIARFEPGYDKKQGIFTIKNWWWEAGLTPSEPLKVDLVQCFRRFLQYLGVDHLQVSALPLEKGSLEWLAAAFS
jgi:uncharacterized protein